MKVARKFWVLFAALLMVCLFGVFNQGKVGAATRIQISKNNVYLDKKVYTYTGKAVKPKITVIYKGKILKKSKDYKVSYKNNKKIGNGTVIVKGTGKYKGSIIKKFQIKHSNKFNEQINFNKLGDLKKLFNLKSSVKGMKVSVNVNKQTVTQKATINGNTYKLNIALAKYCNKTSTSQILTCTELFWECYPQMFERFANSKTPKNITLAIENEGYEIAYEMGPFVHIHDNWLKENKNDFDCLTHEFAHIMQTEWDDNYAPKYKGETFMTERFADYCRYVYASKDGYYNDVSWELQNVYGEDNYSSANRFWVWLDFKYSTNKIDIMKRICDGVNSKKSGYASKNWSAGGKVWKTILKGTKAEGKSLTELWKQYAKSDFAKCDATVCVSGDKSELIERYDARNVIKNRHK